MRESAEEGQSDEEEWAAEVGSGNSAGKSETSEGGEKGDKVSG